MDSAQDLLTFISGSVGGRNAIAKLLGKVARSCQATEGKMPVVALEVGEYDHDDYGTVAYPIFKIVDWDFWDRSDRPAIGAQKPSMNEVLDDEIPF
jgi:hypothetical protein